jgi:hypothetical protein
MAAKKSVKENESGENEGGVMAAWRSGNMAAA